MIEYLSQNLFTIGLGFLLGNFLMWCIWRFFFNFIYQDDNTDEKIDQLEKKIDGISNHIGVQKSKNNSMDVD